MNTFTLIINAGRSGSTFLEHLLARNFSKDRYIAHEDIPVQVSKPRLHNRAYTEKDLAGVLNDTELLSYIKRWEKILKEQSIIETGWTSYHLAPVLLNVFGDAFRFVVLHRDPVSFAFSRANMGSYHRFTFYDNAHEVSPYDPRSIAPEYAGLWPQMNHFEKCLFWWYTVYKEADEFREKHPDVPHFALSSSELFTFSRGKELLLFLGLDEDRLIDRNAPKNELPRFVTETFPVNDEWRNYSKHKLILEYARSLGYQFDCDKIEKESLKYKLKEGIGPMIRHKTGFWRVRSRVVRPLKKLLKKSC